MKRQTIYALGYIKSGTTWLARLLGDALDSPVGGMRPDNDAGCIATEGQDRPGGYYIRQGHAIPGQGDVLIPDRHTIVLEHLTNERIIVMLRDPRDVAVSAAHHWDLSIERTIHCMSRGEWPLTHGGGWCEWVRGWQASMKEVDESLLMSISYEDLRRSEQRAMWCFRDFVGKKISRDVILRAIERQSIIARRTYTKQHGDTLNYGKAFQLRFLRKGIVGDWRNHFTPEHRQLAEGYFGEMMREFGYMDSKE